MMYAFPPRFMVCMVYVFLSRLFTHDDKVRLKKIDSYQKYILDININIINVYNILGVNLLGI